MSVSSAYSEYLRGKKVVLVGGADTFEPTSQFDVVVRANNHWLKCPLDRMDVCYHSAGLEAIINPKCSFIWADLGGSKAVLSDFRKSALRYNFLLGFYYNYHPSWPEDEKYTRPEDYWLGHYRSLFDLGHVFTGIVAFLHLVQQPIERLYLTGFNFYGGPTANMGGHRPENQARLLHRFKSMDKRISFDEELEKCLARYEFPG
jgi:hypothetical protein